MNFGTDQGKHCAYFIASLKHTHNHHHHITWWAPNYCGYRLVVPNAGRYSLADALEHHDGQDCLAIPDCVHFRSLWVPQPREGWYDMAGPVVMNDRESWEVLLALAYNPLFSAAGSPGKHPRPDWKGRRPLPRDVVRMCKECYSTFPGNVKKCPVCGSKYRRSWHGHD